MYIDRFNLEDFTSGICGSFNVSNCCENKPLRGNQYCIYTHLGWHYTLALCWHGGHNKNNKLFPMDTIIFYCYMWSQTNKQDMDNQVSSFHPKCVIMSLWCECEGYLKHFNYKGCLKSSPPSAKHSPYLNIWKSSLPLAIELLPP